MARKKPVRRSVIDQGLLLAGLDGIEKLTCLFRQLAIDSESRAADGQPNAYHSLQYLLREVGELAESGRSAFVADVSNATAEKLSQNCRIALNLGDCSTLRKQCGMCTAKIKEWKPARQVESTRAPLLLGTAEEIRKKRARLDEEYFNDPARVADRVGQEAIRLAVSHVLETLNNMSSSLRKQLVSQGSGECSTGRSWTQTALNEAIKKYREDKLEEFLRWKKAIDEDQPNAISEAQKVFGRNSIAKFLRVCSPAMVTKSQEWQSIASDLNLPRGRSGTRKLTPCQRNSVEDEDSEERTQRLEKISIKFSPQEMEDVRQKLSRGEMSTSEAMDLIESPKKT